MRYSGSVKSRSEVHTSLGVHIRALWEVLSIAIDNLPEIPTERRVRLRTVRAALERAYPEFLSVNETDIAQHLAEEDGDAVSSDI